MASSRTESSEEWFIKWMTHQQTQKLVTAVQKGKKAKLTSAIASGANPKVTIPIDAGVSMCLVTVAATNGHHHLLSRLLQAGLSIEGGGTFDRTPLMEAAVRGHTQTVEALLTFGANPLATDGKGRMALHHAAALGHQQCVATLMPVTPPTPAHIEALTPVHTASYYGHVEVLEQLAGAGWPLTARDSDGDTPLHSAAAGGSVTCQEWLMQRGGDARVQNKAGYTPWDKELVIAVEKGDEARVRSSLARGAHSEITIPTVAGMSRSLVSVATNKGHHHLLPRLLQAGLSIECGGTTNTTPLMEAARKGHTQTVKALLTLGANPLATDRKGRTALHHAAALGHQQCVAALMPFTPPTPAHIEALTPVHTASYYGHVEVLQQLAGAGWPLTARDSDGNTPLHSAAAGGSVTCQEWLVQRGGDARVQNKAGYTPWDKELVIAVKKGDEARVRSSLARGAHSEITIPTAAGMSRSLVSVATNKGHHHLLPRLLQAGLSIEGGGTTDTTPLMEAARKGHIQTVKALLTLGANPLATDSKGRTALHHAAARGQPQCVAVLMPVIPPTPAHIEALTPVHTASYYGHVEVLQQLAGAGWPLTARDSDGDTPLHSAAAGGSVTCQEWLEQRGGDARAQNKAGLTPRDTELVIAVQEGDEARVRSSLARGAHSEISVPTVAGMSWSLVSVAASKGHHHLLPRLLQAGLSIEGEGTTDTTPLMEAARKNHTQTVKALLILGANPLATDSEGRMVLHHAAALGQQQCVAALMSVTPPTPAHIEALTPVHTASYYGHVEVLQQLAGAGWPLTARDSDGNTPLHSAAAGGSVTCQEWLKQRGGDARVQNKAGHTPWDEELVIAVEKGDEARVRSSLARGAHSEITIPTAAGMSRSLVSVAVSKGHHHLLPRLLQAGLSIEGGGTTNTTPLMEAARKGHTQTVKALLTLGAKPLATDSKEWTALHHAAALGQQQCVAALMPVTPPTPAHIEALTPVHTASYSGHVEVLEQLAGAGWPLTARDSDGNTPLHSAAAGGSVTCQEWLVQRGGDERVQNKAGHTPWDTELVIAVKKGDEARVRSSLARGAHSEITIPTAAGMSRGLVSVATNKGHHHLLPRLLQAGLSIECGGTTNTTPLMEAARKGHIQTVKALLTLGANPLATDRKGWTALHHAAARGQQQCVAALTPVIPATPVHLEANTPVHAASYHGHVEVLKQLAGAGWSLTAKDSDGNTPLHTAAWGGSVTCLQWLVNGGGDPRVQNKSGHTPLDVAVQFGRHEVETWLAKNGGAVVRNENLLVEEVRIWRRRHENNHNEVFSFMMEGNEAALSLIPETYDGHAMNQEGLTPLHAAALLGASSRVVKALLRRGVSPHVITPDNMTPADLARQEGHDPVIKGLQCYQCEKGAAPPEHLYQELLSTVSRGDDVQAVSNLLCKGAPIETLGGRSALRLAVTTDRARTVSLLLASGASLSANLLQEAWQSPNVTHRVLASLTSAYCCRLRLEQRRLVKVSRALVEGISNLVEDIEGSTPWLAAWRWGEDTDLATLSYLLAKAAAANCPVTAAFLQSAGAWPFFSQASGGSALHAALDAGHQAMAELLIRDLGGCPYVPDTHGRLPVHMMSDEKRQRLEQRLFEEEREKLKDLEFRQKADREKAAARTALDVQKVLFDNHKKGEDKNVSAGDGSAALLLAARKGLLQLTHLLLREGRRPVDKVVDDTCGTTALHQAASHGQDGCVALLLSEGANTQQCDSYGQTPRLLAAMFGHTSTADLLAQQDVQDPPCRAGTTAKQVTRGFEAYLQLYEKYAHDPLTPFDRHNPDSVTRKLMKCIRVGKLQQEAQRVAVDLSQGEALQIHETVMAELKAIMDNVSAADPTYRGDLRLAGSSRDGSKLYAPDEFDVNIVIHGDDVRVNVSERRKEEALLKGRLQIAVKTDNPNLKGNSFMANLYKEVHRCLADHTLQDERLSLVPPGLTSTQVGVALALAWQGRDYPLLLVGVDLVPVLEVPWLEQIPRPFLTPGNTTTMQLSNAADGSWRCSFALTEAKVLGTLRPAERQLQLMGKVLLSRLKAERWMPRHKKSFCTWFATREWSIPVPSGFCFKNAFLRWLEHRRRGERHPAKQLEAGRERDPARWLVQVFRLMCADPKESRERLTTQNNSAYFGGDCEGRKPGDGAPAIVQCLEEDLEKLPALRFWMQKMQLHGNNQQ
ncbi:uncharacterized protein LOC135115206 [Scylla paramamosain]|uniref:uncharacterized protein LOC135115206 n=1 Tax=Scylla paramamosain TaxID=85552 RepID=UPI003083794E